MANVTILGDNFDYKNFNVGDIWKYDISKRKVTSPTSGEIRGGLRECTLIKIDTSISDEFVFISRQIENGSYSFYFGSIISLPTVYTSVDTTETIFKNSVDTLSFAPCYSFANDNYFSITRNIVKYKNDTLFMDNCSRRYDSLGFFRRYDSLVYLESFGTLRYYTVRDYYDTTVYDSLQLISFNNEIIEYDSLTILLVNVFIDNFTILFDMKPQYPKITGFDDLINLNNKGLFEYIYIYDISGRRIFIMNNTRISDINRIALGNYMMCI